MPVGEMVEALVGYDLTRVLRSVMALLAAGKSNESCSSKFCSPDEAINASRDDMLYHGQRELHWYFGRAAESRRDSYDSPVFGSCWPAMAPSNLTWPWFNSL